jgi:AcrR family transcriptional regulator
LADKPESLPDETPEVTPERVAGPDTAAPRRRTYLPAAERRKLILAAAQEVFARATLRGARTREIAKAASVNQATIFEHFESKEALFEEAVIQPLVDSMRGEHALREGYEAAQTPDELAALAQVSARRHIDDAVTMFPLLTAALFSDPELGATVWREQIAPLVRARSETLEGLTRDGIDPEFVGLVIFGMQYAIALDYHFGGEQLDLSHAAEQFARMATGGFARERRASNSERTNGDPT